MMSDVQNFYANKTIFITGVTGYLGHVLLSKLLCSCPELRCIYVLIREKRGLLVHQRFEEILNDPIFKRAKELHQQDFQTKVRPIRGDCYENDLGISDSDRALIENEVEIVFHVAATVKFNAPLRRAAYVNVRSLDILLQIAQNMKNLKVFAHISTAFTSSSQTKLIEEKFYDSPIKARDLLSLVDLLDDELLDELTPRLIKSCPNTYIYTKLIAEDLCRDKGSGLPLCIFRPAGVTTCLKEPALGWINTPQGPISVALGYAMGLLKVALVDKSVIVNIVPGDYAINALIVSTYYTSDLWTNVAAQHIKYNIPIINYSNSAYRSAVTFERFKEEFIKASKKYPFYHIASLPSTITTKNILLYRFLAFVLHMIPATIADSISVIIGQKPRFKKVIQKIDELSDILSYFALSNWIILNNKADELWKRLSEKDKEIFYFNLDDIDVEHYFETQTRGMRLYLAKESEDTLEKAKKKHRIIRILYKVTITILMLSFLIFLMMYFNLVGEL